MEAYVYKKTGHPGTVLKLERDWPKPQPQGTQILVRVKAVSLNPIGWKAMSTLPFSLQQKKPAVPEADVGGIVAGGNLEGSGLSLGDEIIAFVPFDTVLKNGRGALAQFTLAERHMVVKKPANLSFAQGASFPLAGLTAYTALIRTGKLREGSEQRVFINGGSGGVGAYAVQLAKAYGAHVVTTTSPASADLVSSLHPDATFDYRSENLTEKLAKDYSVKAGQGFDIVFDTVGVKDVYDKAPKYLKRNGVFVDIAGPHMEGVGSLFSALATLLPRFLLPSFLGGNPIKYNFILLDGMTMGKELQECVDMLAKGTIKPMVDSEFAWTDALKAYERQMSGRAKGKVVILVE